MTVLVHGLKVDSGKSFSGVSAEVKMTNGNMVDAVKLKIPKDFDGR